MIFRLKPFIYRTVKQAFSLNDNGSLRLSDVFVICSASEPRAFAAIRRWYTTRSQFPQSRYRLTTEAGPIEAPAQGHQCRLDRGALLICRLEGNAEA